MGTGTDHHSRPSPHPAGEDAGARARVSRGTLAFAAAILLLGVSTLIFWVEGESEWPMFALAFVGVLAGRALGLPQQHLAVVAFGVAIVVWPIGYFGSPIPGLTSTLAHVAVAALIAGVIAGPIRRRWPATRAAPWSARWFAIPAIVLAIGAAWELGEFAADAVVGTDLATPADTIIDLAADLVGAVLGLAFRDRFDWRAPT